ncbi:MAG TPA: site-specific integrase [Tepidisphaeraceae bacterium]|nr:site-specific integrase [Tepidisphaeraceae bacterium]
MPRVPSDYIPTYRNHKSSGQAVVTLNYKDHLLGKFGSPESRVKYHDLIARWLAGGRRPLSPAALLPDDPTRPQSPHLLTIGGLLAAYLRHAEHYYRKPCGRDTGEVDRTKRYTGPLLEIFGDSLASEFGPTKLKIVQNAMIERGWVRTSINGGVGVIRRVFKWAVAEELIRPDVLQSICAVSPLKRGRSKASEADPIRPVDLADVDAIRAFVSPVVWAMVQIQLLTGMRSGELVALKATEIDRKKSVWTYTPSDHKTSHHGHKRVVYIGPKAQTILTGFIVADRPIGAPIFSPRESNALAKAARAVKGKHRRPNQQPNRRATLRSMGDAFTVTSYRRAIARGCELANKAALARGDKHGVESWHPHRLRHTFATTIRAAYGADLALTMLGDKTTRMIDVYAEKDHAAAMKVAAVVG